MTDRRIDEPRLAPEVWAAEVAAAVHGRHWHVLKASCFNGTLAYAHVRRGDLGEQRTVALDVRMCPSEAERAEELARQLEDGFAPQHWAAEERTRR